MVVITPQQLAALRDQGYLVVPADCVPASLMHRAMDAATVPVAEPRVMVRHVIEAAASFWGHSVALLKGQARHPNVVMVRHLGMHVAVCNFGYSLTATALAFGGRDHSTVHHAIHRVQDLLADPATRAIMLDNVDRIATEARRLAADTQVAA